MWCVGKENFASIFFGSNSLFSFGTINLSHFYHAFSLLQKPLHKENIQKGLKKLTNIDRHGSTTFLETINQVHGISYSFDIIVCEHY